MPLVVLLLLLVASRVAFMLLMPHVYSIDLFSWLRVIDNLRGGGNPYRDMEVLNWPPFWMQIIFGAGQVSRKTGISPTLLIQAVLICCEALMLCVTYVAGIKYFSGGKILFYTLLFGLVLNPICLFLSCQHCNYDVFVGLWILLATVTLMDFAGSRNRESWLAACFFIGMGILTKTVPVFLAPLLLAGIKELNWRTRLFGLLLLAAPFTIGMSVLFTLEPYGVLHNVIGYRSLKGWYGFSGLMWVGGVTHLSLFYQRLSPLLFCCVMLVASWQSYKSSHRAPLKVLTSAVIIMLFIPTFGPGYSPPYILWYLPLLVLSFGSHTMPMRRLLVIGGCITVTTYIAEYALLSSHGAFLAQWYPDRVIPFVSRDFGSRIDQTLLRLPMFGFNLILFVQLLRTLRRRPAAATDLQAAPKAF